MPIIKKIIWQVYISTKKEKIQTILIKILKNYIEKTFEVVKHLFDFPKDRFKRIVDNFIKTFDKTM